MAFARRAPLSSMTRNETESCGAGNLIYFLGNSRIHLVTAGCFERFNHGSKFDNGFFACGPSCKQKHINVVQSVLPIGDRLGYLGNARARAVTNGQESMTRAPQLTPCFITIARTLDLERFAGLRGDARKRNAYVLPGFRAH